MCKLFLFNILTKMLSNMLIWLYEGHITQIIETYSAFHVISDFG